MSTAEGRVSHHAVQEDLRESGYTPEEPAVRSKDGTDSDGRVDAKSRSRQLEIKPSSPTGIDAGVKQLDSLGPEGLKKGLVVYEQEGKIPGVGSGKKYVILTEAQARQLNNEIKAGHVKAAGIWEKATSMAKDNIKTARVNEKAFNAAGRFYLRGIRIRGVAPAFLNGLNVIGYAADEVEAKKNRDSLRALMESRGHSNAAIEIHMSNLQELEYRASEYLDVPLVGTMPNSQYNPHAQKVLQNIDVTAPLPEAVHRIVPGLSRGL